MSTTSTKAQTSPREVPGATLSLVFLQRLPGPLTGWQAGHLTYLDEPIQKLREGREGGWEESKS